MDLSVTPAASFDGATREPLYENTDAERLIANEIRRAGTIEEAFALARRTYPLGVDLPHPVREALFQRTAKDRQLQTILLHTAGHDQDLVQDVLVWWWEKGLDGFDSDRATVRTFLRQVMANRILNARRKRRRRGRYQQAVPDEVIASVCDELFRGADVETIAMVSRALDECDPADAMAWTLATIPGYTNEEIARVTGIPLGAVSRATARVRARLERRFGGQDRSLAALFPLAMLQRPGPLERLRELGSLAYTYLRRALRSAAGRAASYGLVATAGAAGALLRPASPPAQVVTHQTVAVAPTVAPVIAPSPSPEAPPAPETPPARPEAVAAPPPPVSRPAVVSPTPRDVRHGSATLELRELEHATATSATRPQTALALFASHRLRWPNSAYSLTRDAAEAETRAQVGDLVRARTLAQRVLRSQPQSPEAFRMRVLGLDRPQ